MVVFPKEGFLYAGRNLGNYYTEAGYQLEPHCDYRRESNVFHKRCYTNMFSPRPKLPFGWDISLKYLCNREHSSRRAKRVANEVNSTVENMIKEK